MSLTLPLLVFFTNKQDASFAAESPLAMQGLRQRIKKVNSTQSFWMSLTYNSAIFHLDNTMGVLREFHIMCNNQECLMIVFCQFFEDIKYL
jgi:hypothetical protein